VNTPSSTRPVGVSLNGSPTNTVVEPTSAPWARPARAVPTSVQLHGLEDDPELYERVIQRVRTAGETVRIEQLIGDLNECSAGQPD
jgi:hypothetical protein